MVEVEVPSCRPAPFGARPSDDDLRNLAESGIASRCSVLAGAPDPEGQYVFLCSFTLYRRELQAGVMESGDRRTAPFVRTRRQERGERGCACRLVSRGSVLRARRGCGRGPARRRRAPSCHIVRAPYRQQRGPRWGRCKCALPCRVQPFRHTSRRTKSVSRERRCLRTAMGE